MKGRNERKGKERKEARNCRNSRKETPDRLLHCLSSQKRRELVLSALLFSSVCIFFEFCSWCSYWWWCVSFDRMEQDQEVLAEKPWRVRRSLCCRPSSFRDIRVFEEKTRRTRQEVYFSFRGTVWGTSERGSSNNIRPADLKWLHLSLLLVSLIIMNLRKNLGREPFLSSGDVFKRVQVSSSQPRSSTPGNCLKETSKNWREKRGSVGSSTILT